jgi:hypothetical protein
MPYPTNNFIAEFLSEIDGGANIVVLELIFKYITFISAVCSVTILRKT